MIYRRINTIITVTVFIFLFCSCSNSSTGNTVNDSGSVKFSIDVAERRQAASPKMAAVDCSGLRINTVSAELRDNQNNLIATGGPWDCTTRQGTLSSIPAGEGYTLIILMKNLSSEVRYQGFVYGITVPAAGIADAGTITVIPVNNPPVISSINGSNRVTGGQGIMQLEVIATDPDGDDLTYTMADLPESQETGYFSSVSFNPDTHIFTWDTAKAYETGEYLVWFIVTDNGIPRRSAWKRFKIFVDYPGSTTPDLQLMLNTDSDIMDVVGRKYAKVGEQFTMQLKDVSDPVHTGTLTYGVAPEGMGLIDSSTYTWTPASSDVGNYLMLFTLSGSGASVGYDPDAKKIIMTVGNRNAPPILEPLGIRRVMHAYQLNEFYATAEDPDSEDLTFYAVGGVVDGTYDPFSYGATFEGQKFSWNPSIEISEYTYSIMFTVTDSSGYSDFWVIPDIRIID
jgi:hypothetical protein